MTEIKDKKLEEMRAAYKEPCMSKEQVEQMKRRIEEARMEKEMENRRNRKFTAKRMAMAAAAVAAAFVILPNTSAGVAHAMESIPVIGRLVEVVTFRNYQYEDDRHKADIEIPELVPQSVVDEPALGQSDKLAQESLQKTTEEINAEIQDITERILAEFEENVQYEQGYQDVMVKSEVINTTEDYFTLKLICYQGAGSGAEWDYFYTIDLTTGERLQLKDIFRENADYITPISENIKTQMQEQMAEDEMKTYWLEQEVEEWNFKQISEETSFYLNADGNVVISFNEGDVAPMYMGVVEFVIPNEVIADIRK